MTTDTLRGAALAVLENNDLGNWTKPAPRLYPHQWSWDSAFIAIGLSEVDPDRALRELETLFAAQWADVACRTSFSTHTRGPFSGS